jgi:pimeloyl-ACP methyl ester carboxylesterase
MRLLRFLLLRLAHVALILAIAVVVFLLIVQHGMIYHPRSYRTEELQRYNHEVVTLNYSTSQGAQQSYYSPPRAPAARSLPAKIWVVFSGNGSRALDWMRFVQAFPSDQDGFLLLDYPGYGRSAGKPSAKSIEESADAAVAALSASLALPEESLKPRLSVLGHSLGAAAALDFADAHPVADIVLVAPFTSLLDMARLRVGWPFCYLLLDRFDNRARLRHITQGDHSPRITILFGQRDESIPFAMGEELARISPKVRFEPEEDMGHVDILALARDRIYLAMKNR